MTTTVTITSGSFASDTTMVISDLSQALIVDSTSLTEVYVPFSATSVCSVSLTFDDSYSAYGGYNVIKLERMANTYVIYFELDKDNEITRYSNFDITVNACSKHTSKSTTITIEQEACESENFIVFTAQQDNSSISLTNVGGNTPNIKISLDSGSTWSTWDYNGITLDSGHSVYMRGMNPSGFSASTSKYSQFVMTGSLAASGNVMSLIDNGMSSTLTIPCSYCYYRLFYGCSSLTSAPVLPATTLTSYCYYTMFSGCSSLTSAPKLPATAIANGCYYFMFYNCSSLTSAPPILPATTLASTCYSGMFWGCSNLTIAPELPATALPATTFINRCYDSMFKNCSNLSYIKCLAISGIDTNNSTNEWVSGVASLGTFVKAAGATWPTGNNGIPTGWTVENYTGN